MSLWYNADRLAIIVEFIRLSQKPNRYQSADD